MADKLKIRLDAHGLLTQINQPAATKAGRDLLTAIHNAETLSDTHDYSTLKAEITAIMDGRIKIPLNRLYWEVKEGLWPDKVVDAFDSYNFYARGLVTGNEPQQQEADGIYVYVGLQA